MMVTVVVGLLLPRASRSSSPVLAGPTMKVILSGPAGQATAEVTHPLGDEEHERLGSSLDLAGGRRSVSSQTMTRRLVSEDSLRLRRQPLGQGLLIYKDLPPMRLSLRPYFRDRRLRALQEGHGDEAQGPDDNAGPSPMLARLKHRLARTDFARRVARRARAQDR